MLIFLLFFFFNFTSILVAFLIFQLFRHLCVDLKKMILSLGRKVRPYIRACPFPCVQYLLQTVFTVLQCFTEQYRLYRVTSCMSFTSITLPPPSTNHANGSI